MGLPPAASPFNVPFVRAAPFWSFPYTEPQRCRIRKERVLPEKHCFANKSENKWALRSNHNADAVNLRNAAPHPRHDHGLKLERLPLLMPMSLPCITFRSSAT